MKLCSACLLGIKCRWDNKSKPNNKVITKSGKDVTKNFLQGAKQVLKLAKLFNIKQVILKQKSPSCGCGKVYDGTFSGTIINGNGMTTQMLKKNKIKVTSEEDL